jgi:hypothetical protein
MMQADAGPAVAKAPAVASTAAKRFIPSPFHVEAFGVPAACQPANHFERKSSTTQGFSSVAHVWLAWRDGFWEYVEHGVRPLVVEQKKTVLQSDCLAGLADRDLLRWFMKFTVERGEHEVVTLARALRVGAPARHGDRELDDRTPTANRRPGTRPHSHPGEARLLIAALDPRD